MRTLPRDWQRRRNSGRTMQREARQLTPPSQNLKQLFIASPAYKKRNTFISALTLINADGNGQFDRYGLFDTRYLGLPGSLRINDKTLLRNSNLKMGILHKSILVQDPVNTFSGTYISDNNAMQVKQSLNQNSSGIIFGENAFFVNPLGFNILQINSVASSRMKLVESRQEVIGNAVFYSLHSDGLAKKAITPVTPRFFPIEIGTVFTIRVPISYKVRAAYVVDARQSFNDHISLKRFLMSL